MVQCMISDYFKLDSWQLQPTFLAVQSYCRSLTVIMVCNDLFLLHGYPYKRQNLRSCHVSFTWCDLRRLRLHPFIPVIFHIYGKIHDALPPCLSVCKHYNWCKKLSLLLFFFSFFFSFLWKIWSSLYKIRTITNFSFNWLNRIYIFIVFFFPWNQ